MYMGCHSATDIGMIRTGWPDGGSYLEQNNILISVFKMLTEIIDEARQEAIRKARREKQ